MQELKYFFNQNLWRIALGLGVLTVVVLAWRQTVAPPPPLPQPTTATAVSSPTPRRTIQITPDRAGLLPTETPTPRPPTATPTPIPVYYEVQSGDVPLAIAAQYDISVDDLLTANDISDPTLLQIGQSLLVPVTVTPSPTAPTPTPTPTLTPTSTPEPVTHTIRAGDTLLEIAMTHEVSLEMLMLANDLSADQTLQIGQTLVIPQGNVDFDTPAVIHIIKSGDTFDYLSFFYGSTVDDILAANPGLKPTRLQLGQKVVIPVTSPPTNPDADPTLPQITAPEAMLPAMVTLQQQMFEAINNQRRSHGLAAYQPDDTLTEMALAHAQDMIKRGYFSHTTPEGITLNDRFARQNIDVGWTGENIQRNVKPYDNTVNEAIRWFMSSRVHRSNILHRHYSHIGVGVAEGPPEWYTFVLVFAER